MTLLTIVGIALGLAMDAFAAAVGASIRLRHVSPRQVFRFGWHFGLFQAIMPVIGWYFGTYLEELIVAWDHWVAF
ncbi:MAG TPA: manganese efflux pump, partial [Candidatus Hydrogenedentes bacterium]|nr:manganese efflux pump [Candidatus Hydrogenedentota bacterium]